MSAPTPPRPLDGLMILVIDDHRDTVDMLREYLHDVAATPSSLIANAKDGGERGAAIGRRHARTDDGAARGGLDSPPPGRKLEEHVAELVGLTRPNCDDRPGSHRASLARLARGPLLAPLQPALGVKERALVPDGPTEIGYRLAAGGAGLPQGVERRRRRRPSLVAKRHDDAA